MFALESILDISFSFGLGTTFGAEGWPTIGQSFRATLYFSLSPQYVILISYIFKGMPKYLLKWCSKFWVPTLRKQNANALIQDK